MIGRCYDDNLKKINPSYNGCSVIDDWIIFSNFRGWMEKQDWKGKSIDKDIINPGNKIYSPENCVFVLSSLNNLVVNKSSLGSNTPVGVYKCKRTGSYSAKVRYRGGYIHLGVFELVEKADQAYRKEKYNIIMEFASIQSDSRVANGLRKHAEILLKS